MAEVVDLNLCAFSQYAVDIRYRLAEFMRTSEGKVVVSINDHTDIRAAFDGFHFERLDIRYTTPNQRRGQADVTGELVIMN